MFYHLIPKSSSLQFIKKLFQVGTNTFLSRIFGLLRELLLLRLLGITGFADAFNTAFSIPNAIRKIFVEGAFSAAFIPLYTKTITFEGRHGANGLMTLTLLVMQSIIIVIAALVMFKAHSVIALLAPGYDAYKIAYAVPLVRVLMPFVVLLSVNALFAAPLQSSNHFFLPSFGPIFLNLVYMAGIALCLFFELPVVIICWTLLVGSLLLCVAHIIYYHKYGFSYAWWNKKAISHLTRLLIQFILCFLGMSVIEFCLLIDHSLASYMADGSVTLVKEAFRLMAIPLGVFAGSFSTILLPHLTHLHVQKSDMLELIMKDILKIIIVIVVPMAAIMSFLAEPIFVTLFVPFVHGFSALHVAQGALLLQGFVIGFIFFSVSRFLYTVFYALHDALTPTVIACITLFVNACAGYYGMLLWGSFGLACATSCAAFVQMALSFFFLTKTYHYNFKWSYFLPDCGSLLLIAAVALVPFYFLYGLIYRYLLMTQKLFFIESVGFWLWVLPLIALYYIILYVVFYMKRALHLGIELKL